MMKTLTTCTMAKEPFPFKIITECKYTSPILDRLLPTFFQEKNTFFGLTGVLFCKPQRRRRYKQTKIFIWSQRGSPYGTIYCFRTNHDFECAQEYLSYL